MQDAFISALSSHSIQQQLLENKTIDLQTVYMQASALDLAQQNNELYTTPEAKLATLVNPEPPKVVYRPSVKLVEQAMAVAYQAKRKCFFCGFPYHSWVHCPACVATCKKCSKKGHYACAGRFKPLLASIVDPHVLTMYANVPRELLSSAASIIINKIQLSALLDSCSTDSYSNDRVAQELKLEIHPSNYLGSKNFKHNLKGIRSCKFTFLL